MVGLLRGQPAVLYDSGLVQIRGIDVTSNFEQVHYVVPISLVEGYLPLALKRKNIHSTLVSEAKKTEPLLNSGPADI